MPKFITSTILLLLFTTAINAQKILEKQYGAQLVKKIVVDGTGVYEIRVITENRTTISLKATIAGETANDVMITEKNSQKKLNFGVKYAPYFSAENDKLSAHKVLSVILEFRIPEAIEVEVTSNIGSFWGTGAFKDLNVSLERGSCFLDNFFGNATIMTLTGAVEVEVLGNVSGTALSKNGHVVNQLERGHKRHISAESRDGNITLTQTEN